MSVRRNRPPGLGPCPSPYQIISPVCSPLTASLASNHSIHRASHDPLLPIYSQSLSFSRVPLYRNINININSCSHTHLYITPFPSTNLIQTLSFTHPSLFSYPILPSLVHHLFRAVLQTAESTSITNPIAILLNQSITQPSIVGPHPSFLLNLATRLRLFSLLPLLYSTYCTAISTMGCSAPEIGPLYVPLTYK